MLFIFHIMYLSVSGIANVFGYLHKLKFQENYKAETKDSHHPENHQKCFMEELKSLYPCIEFAVLRWIPNGTAI